MLLKKFEDMLSNQRRSFSLNNQRGASIVQVMMIAGMVSVFGLAVMQTQQNMTSTKTTIEVRNANTELRDSIMSLLKFPDVCELNIGSASRVPNLASIANKPGADDFASLAGGALYDADGAVAFQNYDLAPGPDFVYFGRIQIQDILVGHYDAAKSLATLRVQVNTGDPLGKNRFNLGGNTHNLDIPLRIYFDSSTGNFKRCFTEDRPIELDGSGNYIASDESVLQKLCTLEMGGSFSNGDCLYGQNLINIARQESALNERGEADPNYIRSICNNFGSALNADGQCKKRFESTIPCPSGTKLTGFDSEGKFICQ